jgi:hypothetical protein
LNYTPTTLENKVVVKLHIGGGGVPQKNMFKTIDLACSLVTLPTEPGRLKGTTKAEKIRPRPKSKVILNPHMACNMQGKTYSGLKKKVKLSLCLTNKALRY